jgi:diacylglycerol kinase (ATP)
MRQHFNNNDKFTIANRVRSIMCATRGILIMLLSVRNAWLHGIATAIVVVAGIVCGITRLEWCALVLAMVAVWTAEALNTALELLCDVTMPDFHPLINQAKDVAAGAVLICAIGAFIVGLIIFAPYVLAIV